MNSDLSFRLRKRAEIRRQIPSRKSVQEGKPDRISDLLEEAADALENPLKLQVYDWFDDHECDTCGSSYASGYVVINADTKEVVLELEPIASCFGGNDYDIFDLIAALQKEFPTVQIGNIEFSGEYVDCQNT